MDDPTIESTAIESTHSKSATSLSRSRSLRFQKIRHQSVAYCQPLALEDYGLQAMAETSPPKWHLAHTTWFFETFILKPFVNDYCSPNPQYEVLFNSYYNGIGRQHPRHQRGLLSRPSVEEVLEYRGLIDQQIIDLLNHTDHPHHGEILTRLELGLNHEQQHQELFFTDLKYSFFQNPLYPTYANTALSSTDKPALNRTWIDYQGGLIAVGQQQEDFCFDNELPRHQVMLTPFQLANRLVTNGEFLAFIEDGAYQRPDLWLADAWATVQQHQWRAPLYWLRQDNQWLEYTLHGLAPVDYERPVVHVSAYEADAYARWAEARLASEFELEYAANQQAITGQFITGQFIDNGEFHPQATQQDNQVYGTAWEWTHSAYGPYPNFRAGKGAIGEYNGKFMCNQLVLRGGSCVTSRDHIRSSYRNFFYPQDRWQFSGIRIAQSA